ncbi:helix-turn-helix domain-containing protein [Nocardia sp. NPDC020380]|uniref:helix-turn-helix domain-containing protein n=1 Tax=Nocardia sp. NPDC020380 TaxID=3364309 RepID=UPI0037A142DC
MTADAAWGNDFPELEAPTFGNLLRRLRDARGISRERLAFNAGVSASYITHLEKGDRGNPTREVVTALMRYLDRLNPLTLSDRRQLADLAGLENNEIPDAALLRAAVTPDMRAALDLHRPNPAGYLDVRGNVLACNDGWDAAYPGMSRDGNVFRWYFGNDMSRRVMVNWENDVNESVRWLRGTMGRIGSSGFLSLIDELAVYPHFRKLWADGGVDFAPHIWSLELRDPSTGARRRYYTQTGSVAGTAYPGHLVMVIALPG